MPSLDLGQGDSTVLQFEAVGDMRRMFVAVVAVADEAIGVSKVDMIALAKDKVISMLMYNAKKADYMIASISNVQVSVEPIPEQRLVKVFGRAVCLPATPEAGSVGMARRPDTPLLVMPIRPNPATSDFVLWQDCRGCKNPWKIDRRDGKHMNAGFDCPKCGEHVWPNANEWRQMEEKTDWTSSS